MPREEAQEAAKLLFINAGESKERVVQNYQVQTLCWLQMQPETNIRWKPDMSLQR